MSRKERRETREIQRITSEASASPVLLKIYIIEITPFAQLTKNLKIDLFIVIMIDIEKVLKEKSYSDPITFLFEEYQDFLDVFSREKADKLPPH